MPCAGAIESQGRRGVADLQYEYALQQQGFANIAGIDEAGRGAWAGPVVAGAVILPLDRFDLAAILDGVNDSKQLTAARREMYYERIVQTARAIGIGYATHAEIDAHGIVPATQLAAERAIARLDPQPDHLLTDFMQTPRTDLPCITLKKGDQKALSIAAASIIAKVSRDRFMDALDATYPQYGFLIHKGYGTALHRHALEVYGPTDIHRMSFSPLGTE